MLNEALNTDQQRLIRKFSNGYEWFNAHDEVFDRYGKRHSQRIILPFEPNEKIEPDKTINNHLNKHGWFISDYAKGHAVKYFTDQKGNKRKTVKSIGKVLQDTGGADIEYPTVLRRLVKGADGKPIRDENGRMVSESYKGSLLHFYNTDPKRDANKQDLQIVISRHRDDIGGMSSGRSWEANSCMRLPYSELGIQAGVKHKSLAQDFKHHTLVAYLTKKGDDEVEAPLARISIKKYVEGRRSIYRIGSDVYGDAPKGFRDAVQYFTLKNWPMKVQGTYEHPNLLYVEGATRYGYEPPMLQGLHKKGTRTTHYDENGLATDYIDENGISRPAIQDENGNFIRMKHGIYHAEEGKPSIKDDTGETYHVNGVLHNPNGASSVMNYDGIEHEEHHLHGVPHREGDKPSYIGKRDGVLQEVKYQRYGMFHRDGDKPSHIYRDGEHVVYNYHKNGELHRDGDKPAIIRKDKNGEIVGKEYYKNGVLHRDGDKPAKTRILKGVLIKSYYKNGKLYRENGKRNSVSAFTHDGMGYAHVYHDENGETHRESGLPARIIYRKDGSIASTHWLTHGKPSDREGKPNGIQYRKDGTKEKASHFVNVDLHSVNGKPSQILYDEKGNVIEKTWHKDGVEASIDGKPSKVFYKDGKVVRKEWVQITPNNPFAISYNEDGSVTKEYDRSGGRKITKYPDGTIIKNYRDLVHTIKPSGSQDFDFYYKRKVSFDNKGGAEVSDEMIDFIKRNHNVKKHILDSLYTAKQKNAFIKALAEKGL